MSKLRVFIATSLDGFIAGPNDELDWLPTDDARMEDTFTPFMAGVGAMLMGRRTYDVVQGFQAAWPYGDTPVLVATQRELQAARPSIRAVSGDIRALVDTAKAEARERDVYIDGGALIRSALDAELIDEVTITLIPKVLGQGIPLFAGCTRVHSLQLVSSRPIGAGLLQVVYSR
jgi:dihydrofolate reductase